MLPLYDVHKTFEDNVAQGPFFEGTIPTRLGGLPSFSFFGFPLHSPIGVAACPLTLSGGIALLSSMGFDIFTYKTILAHPRTILPFPNLHVIDADPTSLTLANSIGMGCGDPESVARDIAKAKRALSVGQILMVSVYGEGETLSETISLFCEAASLAKAAGADIVEANLSCPNVKVSAFDCFDITHVSTLVSALVKKMRGTPVTVKLGVCPTAGVLKEILCSVARAGAQGICGINSIKRPILHPAGDPVFGAGREYAGVSGAAIRPFALAFVQEAYDLIQKEKLGLKLIATGGVTQPEHFQEFLDAGADIALSATGVLWNPYLATEYHREKYEQTRNSSSASRN